MKLFVITVVAVSFLLAGTEDAAESKFSKTGHAMDSVKLVKQRLKQQEAVLIDVREQQEWDAGHLKAAHLVPLSAVRANELTEEMKKHLPKNKPIYCHCRSGGRVLMVSKLLREQGFDIRPLNLGYEKLLEAGFEKAPDKPAPKNED